MDKIWNTQNLFFISIVYDYYNFACKPRYDVCDRSRYVGALQPAASKHWAGLSLPSLCQRWPSVGDISTQRGSTGMLHILFLHFVFTLTT